jgi:hypothetical protein
MAARFEKISVPPLGDFDGFDQKTVYQMVPVGDVREMSVVTEDDECTIVVDPPNIAKMQRFFFDKPLLDVPREFRARVTSRNRIRFQLFGQQKGNTTLFLVDRSGKAFATLLVSVKAAVAKSVAFCLLSDMKRNSPFSAVELPSILTAVQQTFKQQANIGFTQIGTVFPVNVTANLGNPLILDKPNIRSAILSATPQSAILANFVVYFTWDVFTLVGRQIVGVNFGFDCYAEQLGDPFQNAMTVAHELGHGLGLGHSSAKTMMAGDGNSRTSKLQQFEIDTINQTDAP